MGLKASLYAVPDTVCCKRKERTRGGGEKIEGTTGNLQTLRLEQWKDPTCTSKLGYSLVKSGRSPYQVLDPFVGLSLGVYEVSPAL